MSTLADASIFKPSAFLANPVFVAGFDGALIGHSADKNSQTHAHANPNYVGSKTDVNCTNHDERRNASAD